MATRLTRNRTTEVRFCRAFIDSPPRGSERPGREVALDRLAGRARKCVLRRDGRDVGRDHDRRDLLP